MSVAHITVDLLSAYLDQELSPDETDQICDHLEGCPECQHQLDGLGRVVGRLRRLERIAPPQLLEMDVQRRVALAVPEDRFFGRFDGRIGRLPIQPGILVTFALVFAFAAILFTFAEGLNEREVHTIPVILSPSGSSDGVERTKEPLGHEIGWRRIDGAWEEGTIEGAAELKLQVGSAEWEAELEISPELASLIEFLRESDVSVKLDDGRIVQLMWSIPDQPLSSEEPLSTAESSSTED